MAKKSPKKPAAKAGNTKSKSAGKAFAKKPTPVKAGKAKPAKKVASKPAAKSSKPAKKVVPSKTVVKKVAPAKKVVKKTATKATVKTASKSISKAKPVTKPVAQVKNASKGKPPVKAQPAAAKKKETKTKPVTAKKVETKSKPVDKPVSKPETKKAPAAAPVKQKPEPKATAKPAPTAEPKVAPKAPAPQPKGKGKKQPKPFRDTTGLPVLQRQPLQEEGSLPTKEVRTSKYKKYELEYFFNASSRLLYDFISNASGLSDWFADNVIVNSDGTYSFIWEGVEQRAKTIYKRENQIVRYKWIEEPSDTYFEFRIVVDELTSDVALIITDFAEDDQSVEAAKLLWDSQINALKHAIGAY